MSIQKKSLISALKTTKKANVANAPLAEDGAPNAKNISSMQRMNLKASGLQSLKGVTTKRLKAANAMSLKGVTTKRLKATSAVTFKKA
jgi:hypothetical protein